MNQEVKPVKLNFPYTGYNISYIEKMLAIYELNNISENYQLCKKEKLFFCNLVRLYNKGVDLNSLHATKELQKLSGITAKNRGVYIYKGILKRKGWLAETKDDRLEIPNFFKKGHHITKIEITLSYDQDS